MSWTILTLGQILLVNIVNNHRFVGPSCLNLWEISTKNANQRRTNWSRTAHCAPKCWNAYFFEYFLINSDQGSVDAVDKKITALDFSRFCRRFSSSSRVSSIWESWSAVSIPALTLPSSIVTHLHPGERPDTVARIDACSIHSQTLIN